MQNEAQISQPPAVSFRQAGLEAGGPPCCAWRQPCSRARAGALAAAASPRPCCRCRRLGRVIDQTGTRSRRRSGRRSPTNSPPSKTKPAARRSSLLMVATTAPGGHRRLRPRVADQWKIGRLAVGDGLLIVVAKNDHRVRIEVAKALEGAVPDLAAGRSSARPSARPSAGDYAGGLNAAIDALMHPAMKGCPSRILRRGPARRCRKPGLQPAGSGDLPVRRRARDRRGAHRHPRPQAGLAGHRTRPAGMGWWLSASLASPGRRGASSRSHRRAGAGHRRGRRGGVGGTRAAGRRSSSAAAAVGAAGAAAAAVAASAPAAAAISAAAALGRLVMNRFCASSSTAGSTSAMPRRTLDDAAARAHRGARVAASEAPQRRDPRLRRGRPAAVLPVARRPARERALAMFGKLRVWDTEHNNGVLIGST